MVHHQIDLGIKTFLQDLADMELGVDRHALLNKYQWGYFNSLLMEADTMTAAGFCLFRAHSISMMKELMSDDKTRSFWALNLAWTVDNFLSKKMDLASCSQSAVEETHYIEASFSSSRTLIRSLDENCMTVSSSPS